MYYVGGNILGLEKRFAFRPRDFRLWIAIHEVTHRAQFTGRAVDARLLPRPGAPGASTSSTPTRGRSCRRVTGALDEVRAGRNPLDEGGVVGLFASAEQRGVLGQVQALMSVLEGHGNVVMDDLGPDHVAGPGTHVARAVSSAGSRAASRRSLHKLLGLEQKMRQYEIGEKFVRGVDRRRWRARDRRGVANARSPADRRASSMRPNSGSCASVRRALRD